MQQSNFVKNKQDIINVCNNFSFPTIEDQWELVRNKLAVAKHKDGKVLFKYHRSVMYDYAWNKSKHLMECRGHVYDEMTGDLLVAPPRKSFNYLENDWWKDIDLDTEVWYNRKYNGFLACVDYKGNVTTTGSLESEYSKMAEYNLAGFSAPSGWTMHCEIMHKDDPHIVAEKEGFELLCQRGNFSGFQVPSNLRKNTLKYVLDMSNVSFAEGFMVYHPDDYMFLSPAKIKTPYYVGKKKLMRATDKAVERMYTNPAEYAKSLPMLWGKYPEFICKSAPQMIWKNTTEQERRKFIEDFQSQYLNFDY